MAGFNNDVVYADNVDFSGGSSVTGKVTLDGQLLIGSAVAPNIRVNTLTAGTGIAITNGSGTITISNTGGGGGGTGATSIAGNSGSAPNIAGVINVVGSTGLTTTGDNVQTLTITPTGSLLSLNNLAGTGYVVQTGANTFTNRTFLAGSGISLTNADGVAGATTITAGATVPTTFTNDTGSATPAASNLNVLGTSAQGISTSGSGSTVTITASNATSTQKGVASFNATQFTVTAGAVASNALTVTAGTGLSTGGSVNLGGSVTLNLTVPVIVANGGTGLTTITQNGVVYGNGTSAAGITAAGTNGQVLIGGTGVAPAFATISGTQGVTLTPGSNTLSIGLVNVPNSALQNSSITVTAGSGISVSGSPVSLGGAVTISATGTIVTQFSADSGIATPSGNNVNLLGTAAQGLSTSASGATVTFTNADWTTTQKGVGTLATNAETIAGTDNTKAVTPDDLKAKLGVQTAHGVALFEGSTSAMSVVAPGATSGIPLINQAAADPIYGTAVVAGGGTGATSFTAYSVITGGTTSTGALQNVSGVGTSGQILTSNGSGNLPSWQDNTAGGGLLVATVTLTSAQIKALNVTPIEIIPAPGAGKTIIVVSMAGKFNYGGNNAFTGTALLGIFYSTTVSIGNANGTRLISNGIMTGTTNGYVYMTGQISTTTDVQNLAVNAYNSGSAFAGNAANDNTVSLNIMYRIITLA